MTEFSLLHRRSDGTFVVVRFGHPYHVIQNDPLYPAVAAAAEGVTLPPEPAPEPAPAPPPPTLASLQADLARIQAQIDALAAGGDP